MQSDVSLGQTGSNWSTSMIESSVLIDVIFD